jgi:cell division protein FtsN
VSPERDEPTEEQEHEPELYDEVAPRSIFAATWFRVVLVVIVLGVIGAVAVPYVLDWMNPPPSPRTAATTALVPPTPVTDTPTSAEPKDATLVPAPAAPTSADAPAARRDLAGDAKPGAPVAPQPAVEPKPPADSKPVETKAASEPTPATAASPSRTVAALTDSAARPPAPTPAKEATAARPPAAKRAVARAATPAVSGPFWVQVGAFKDGETARRLAAKLREANFKVEQSLTHAGSAAKAPAGTAATPAPAAADHYDVFVTGMSAEDLNRRLTGKGLTAETSGGGLVVKPSLPLRDAVALSKDLAVEGFKVQVRRAGGASTAMAAAAPAAGTEGGVALHRVRVGAFADRAAAQAAARELEAKGYKPFIARGDQ